MPQYSIKNNIVFFGTKKLNAIDVSSFSVLESNFARDKHTLYYKGIATALDWKTYQLCGQKYIKDSKGVYLILAEKLKPIKADPVSFEAFGDSLFARDTSCFYYEGKRIRVKDQKTFQIIEDSFAFDQGQCYFGSMGLKLRFAPENTPAKVMSGPEGTDTALIIIGRNVILKTRHDLLQVEAADPESIRFVNEYYLSDKNHFYFKRATMSENKGQQAQSLEDAPNVLLLDNQVFRNGSLLRGADGQTFHKLDDAFFDKNQIYLNQRDRHEKKVVLSDHVTQECLTIQVITESIRDILQLLFYLFDHYRPMANQIGEVDDQYRKTDMPEYRITLQGAQIRIHYQGRTIAGVVSAFLFLGSEFWSIARKMRVKGEPMYRLIYNNQDYADGYYLITIVQKTLGEHFVRIAAYFFYQGERREAFLICNKLFCELACLGDRAGDILKTCPYELLRQTPLFREEKHEWRWSNKTSNLARAKQILPFIENGGLFTRLYYAKEMFGLIAATGNIDGFFKPALLPLMAHTEQEKEPHLREILFQCLDLAAAIYFRHIRGQERHAGYKKAYPLVQCLAKNRVNYDLNLARLWECAHVFNNAEEIEDTAQKLEDVMAWDLPAPGMWWSESAYPGYRAWLIGATLRLAYFYTPVQAEEVVRKAHEALEPMRLAYNAWAAGGSFAILQIQISELCKAHGLKPPFEDHTYQQSCSGLSNWYKTISEADFLITGHRILQYGKFEKKKHNPLLNLTLVNSGSDQMVGLGDYIGIDYLIDGQPWARQLKTTVVVHHPRPIDGRKQSIYTEQSTQVGVKSSFYWCFQNSAELQTGQWKFELTFPDYTVLKNISFMVAFNITVKDSEAFFP